ncbi:perilipin-3-like [Malurus melanocephalus]|uniref:perilipin-3-like n=1 Tax=Malurus melanocephalus TaxID=175006 RepID=UPI002547E62A|nr:perilipin-3-like [Malurus melanocephalus]
MATSEPTPAQPKAEEQQNIGTRVANLPLVSSAYDMVSSAYTCTKESHPYVRSVCDAAEKGVKTLTAAPAKLATAVEGFEPEQQKQKQSYFVRLGSLSSKVQHRALQHSLGKLQSARQSSQELLAQLQSTLDLVEQLKQGMDQRLQGGQEKLQQLWLEWSKKQPGGGKDQVPPETVESGTLTMLQGLSQQLQSSCQPLLSSLQGLPAGIQDTAGQVRQNVEELRAGLASVTSLQDVTGPVLARARTHATKARQLMDELVEHVAFNTPLTWLVGPFAPSGQRPVEME